MSRLISLIIPFRFMDVSKSSEPEREGPVFFKIWDHSAKLASLPMPTRSPKIPNPRGVLTPQPQLGSQRQRRCINQPRVGPTQSGLPWVTKNTVNPVRDASRNPRSQSPHEEDRRAEGLKKRAYLLC